MNFRLVGHDRVNAVHELLICLLPDQDHRQAAEGEPLGDRWLLSALEQGTVLCQGMWDGTPIRYSMPAPADFGRDQRYLSQAVRETVFEALLPVIGQVPPWGLLTGVKPSKLVRAELERGGSLESADALLREKYRVSDRRRALCLETGQLSYDLSRTVGDRDIDLYVGVPFCPAKCSYCSFVSNTVQNWGHLIAPYLDALVREIAHTGKLVKEYGFTVRSVYLGGGTPTIFDLSGMEKLLRALTNAFDMTGIEFTVEGGRPETLSEDKLRLLAAFGVTRISVNPQSMHQHVLNGVGRCHSIQSIVDTYHLARRCGDFIINMDLIAGLPGDDEAGLLSSVRQVLELEPDNLTIHCLARKRGAPLRFGKQGTLPAEVMDRCHDAVFAAGYRPYYLYRQKYMAGGLENVGFCRPGTENRYNIVMMEELAPVAALGCGGIGKVLRGEAAIKRFANPKYPIEYIDRQESILAEKSMQFAAMAAACRD